ncbi:hypothetical protein IWQ60_011921, partial [Tieghemiomyces parasiticus]
MGLTVVSRDAEAALLRQATATLNTDNPDMVVVMQDAGPWNAFLKSAGTAALRWVPFAILLLLAIFALGYTAFSCYAAASPPTSLDSPFATLPTSARHLYAWAATMLWLVGRMALPPTDPAIVSQVIYAMATHVLFSVAVSLIALDWVTNLGYHLPSEHRLGNHLNKAWWVAAVLGAIAVAAVTATSLAYVISYAPSESMYGARQISDPLFAFVLPVLFVILPFAVAAWAVAGNPERNYFESSRHNVSALIQRVALFGSVGGLIGGLVGAASLVLGSGQINVGTALMRFTVASILQAFATTVFSVCWVLLLFHLGRLRLASHVSAERSRQNSCASTTPMMSSISPLPRDQRARSLSASSMGNTSAVSGRSSFADPFYVGPPGKLGVRPGNRRSRRKSHGNRKSSGSGASSLRISNPIVHAQSGLDHYLDNNLPPVPPIPFAVSTANPPVAPTNNSMAVLNDYTVDPATPTTKPNSRYLYQYAFQDKIPPFDQSNTNYPDNGPDRHPAYPPYHHPPNGPERRPSYAQYLPPLPATP